MYHYKARIYSPTLGRFLQTDPIGYNDQVNLYTYVGNDPTNARDPTGKRMKLSGGDEERRRFIQLVYRGTGQKLKERDGHLVRDGKRDKHVGNADAARTLRQAIRMKETVNVDAVSAQRNVFVDSFATNQVDVADMEGMAARSEQLGAATLTHVLSERIFAAKNPTTDYNTAHDHALRAESKVTGAFTRTESYIGVLAIDYHDKAGVLVQSFPFTFDGNLTPR